MNTPNPFLTQETIVIGYFINKQGSRYLTEMHGLGNVTKMHPLNFKSPGSFKKLLQEQKDEKGKVKKMVYVLGHDVDEQQLTEARNAGLSFVQLQMDKRQSVLGFWTNVTEGQQILEISNVHEIQAFKANRPLVPAI